MAQLTSLQRACERVRGHVRANRPEERGLSATLGAVLAEDVVAASDAPPYDKSLVDGYAVVAADLASGTQRLGVVQSVMAGQVPQHVLRSGQATRIDPEPLVEAQTLAKEIIERDLPLFGICLGHQVIALANGISTYKMHHGHRGINHPVKNLITGKGEITSQNHGFAINREEAESKENIEITHLHLNDHTVAGIRMKNKNCFSVQYHPEASPGPNDSVYLFDQFIENIKNS